MIDSPLSLSFAKVQVVQFMLLNTLHGFFVKNIDIFNITYQQHAFICSGEGPTAAVHRSFWGTGPVLLPIFIYETGVTINLPEF